MSDITHRKTSHADSALSKQAFVQDRHLKCIHSLESELAAYYQICPTSDLIAASLCHCCSSYFISHSPGNQGSLGFPTQINLQLAARSTYSVQHNSAFHCQPPNDTNIPVARFFLTKRRELSYIVYLHSRDLGCAPQLYLA